MSTPVPVPPCPYRGGGCIRPHESPLSPPGMAAQEVDRGHPTDRACDTCPAFLDAAKPPVLSNAARQLLRKLPPPRDHEGARLGKPKGTPYAVKTMQHALTRLVRQGFVWKAADPANRRSRRYWLSPLGEGVVHALRGTLSSNRSVRSATYWDRALSYVRDRDPHATLPPVIVGFRRDVGLLTVHTTRPLTPDEVGQLFARAPEGVTLRITQEIP